MSPGTVICSLNCKPTCAFFNSRASAALRTSIGSRRRVLAVELEQVEGPHERVAVLVTPPQFLEDRQTVSITRHRLAVDDAGAHRQRRHGLDDQRIARGEVGAVPGQETNAGSATAGEQPEPVMLDLVEPVRSGRRAISQGGKAELDEAGSSFHSRHPMRARSRC
jgi:hypothetical protein